MQAPSAVALGLACLLIGCGYVGDPKPPSLGIPKTPTGFTALQVGGRISGEFTASDSATDVAVLRSVDAVVRVGTREIPFVAEPGKVVRYAVDSAEWTGQTIRLAARLRGPTGRFSEWSNEVQLHVETPVAKPTTFNAEVTARGVVLRWTPETAAVLFRRVAGEGDFAAIPPAAAPPALDEAAEVGKRYEYAMQAKKGDALSELTAPVAITVQDRFPPAVPTGLDAVEGLRSIELSWDLQSDADADFAGWIIYRAAAGGGFVKIAGPIVLPSYSDATAQVGVAYRYAVSSVDRTGNESARSEAAEAMLPQ